jgi:Cu/Ag efflux pump CusA
MERCRGGTASLSQHRFRQEVISSGIEGKTLILMTSFAFILGVLPLVIAKGAGPKWIRRWVLLSSLE